jgi:hypothetical protein
MRPYQITPFSGWTWAQLDAVTGGLSAPGKMPGPSWSIPATVCKTGSKLRKIKGSVCYSCYALKGRYGFPNVQNALNRRLLAYESDPKRWIGAMAESIRKSKTMWFRWFDSGDLQSVDMLEDIATVAKQTPLVDHWLPTRERVIVRSWHDCAIVPDNLTIRLSGAMVGEGASPLKGLNIPLSVVRAKGQDPLKGEHRCPAPSQGNRCGDCRACWSSKVATVSYGAH